MKNDITLRVLHHRGVLVTAIQCTYREAIRAHLRKFPGVRWSQTNRVFYVPFAKATVSALILYLRKRGYAVDASLIQKQLQKQGATKNEAKPALSVANLKRLHQYEKYLKGLRLSPRTITAYGIHIRFFLGSLNDVPLERIDNTFVRLYLENLLARREYSISTHRQIIGAIKHFSDLFSVANISNSKLARPRKSSRLPQVLSQEEVIDLLRATTNLKHRTTLALLYSSGMRIGEVIQLELRDIDIDRRQLIIRQGKGRKDRYVVLAESFVPLLYNYISSYQPKRYFIEGARGGCYCPTSIRAFLKRSCLRAGIRKHVTPHTLRHSYATHLIENGVNLRLVQELLGHAKPETTMVYTHVAKKDLLSIKSPLDTAILRILKSDKKALNMSLSGNLKG